MTTPRDILEGAYGYSLKNQPGDIATKSTELLNVVTRAMDGLYAFAARINPTFFADIVNVSYDGSTGWPRPDGAESVYRIEIESDGTEVAVVPYDDQDAEPGSPQVFQLGKIYRRAAGDTELDTQPALSMYYSIRPSSPANLDADLDDSWEETFDELLMLEVAVYLALKDGRGGEIEVLVQERNQWAQRFGAFLEHETANERRRWGHTRNFYSDTLFPAASILAANSSSGG